MSGIHQLADRDIHGVGCLLDMLQVLIEKVLADSQVVAARWRPDRWRMKASMASRAWPALLPWRHARRIAIRLDNSKKPIIRQETRSRVRDMAQIRVGSIRDRAGPNWIVRAIHFPKRMSHAGWLSASCCYQIAW